MVVLPPYIRALGSPRRSPQAAGFPSAYSRTCAIPNGIEEAAHTLETPANQDFLISDCGNGPGSFSSGKISKSLDAFSYSANLDSDEQSEANSELWKLLLENNSATFSPRRGSIMPTESRYYTRAEGPSPLTQQLTSVSSYVPAAQSTNDNDFSLSDFSLSDFSLSDFNLDPNLSVFERSLQGSTTAHRSSPQPDLHSCSPGQRMSNSPIRLTDRRNTHYEDIELNMDSGNTSTAGQVRGPVTEEDVSTQSIASLLVLLRSLIFPRFDTASQKYEYGNSVLSDLLGPDRCERLFFEYEELLESYLERSLETIRKRRSARIYGTFSSGPNLYVCGPKEGSVGSDVTTMRSKPTEATIAPKLQNTFSHRCETPMGVVLFRVREVLGDPTEEEGIGSEPLVRISFMPRASERTTGLCVQLFGQIGGPAIIREINTFNVRPYGRDAVLDRITHKDLKGIQTLFDLGEASARDVDPRGVSLVGVGTDAIRRGDSLCLLKLQSAMYIGSLDIFRLLLQRGASPYVREDSGRITDVITVIWKHFAAANSGQLWGLEEILLRSFRSFKHCVALTEIALENDCTIDSAYNRTLAASPLFNIVGQRMEEADPVDAINYLFSIGWDFEEQNHLGQTPLLYAACECYSPAARCLRTLIGRGARLDARDDTGRGPLHCALCPTPGIKSWANPGCTFEFEETGNNNTEEVEYSNNTLLRSLWVTEDDRFARDYYDAETRHDCPTTSQLPNAYRSSNSLDGVRISQLVPNNGCIAPAEQTTPTEFSSSDSDSDASTCAEDGDAEDDEDDSEDDDNDYVYCADEEGNYSWIRNPVHVLKNRVKTKLKILLEAGCDPNDFDDHGKSPNDYADDGLWPQWLWALETTGYVYDGENGLWVKQVAFT